MHKKTIICTLFGLGLLVGATCSAQNGATRIGTIDFRTIEIAGLGQQAMGGSLAVFENNVVGRGRKIALNIVVLPARGQAAKGTPLFFIFGGPGAAASQYTANFVAPVFKAFGEKHDLVVVDQRGTGGSNPLKGDLTEFSRLQDFLVPTIDTRVVAANKDRYRELADLQHYTSLNAVMDLESVRQAMAYEKINIYATSYGVRPALIYMNRYPRRVRSAILKGVVAPSAIIAASFAKDAERSLGLLVEKCENEPACRDAFPDFREEFDAVVQRLDHEPARIMAKNPVTGKRESAVLDRETFTNFVRTVLMNTGAASNLPFAVHAAYANNYEPIVKFLLLLKQSYRARLYEGMSLAVLCAEDYPRFDSLDLSEATKNTFLDRAWIDPAVQACQTMGLQNNEPPDYLNISEKLETPVLLISGNLDAATPPQYGNEVAARFPNGLHLIVKNGSHSFSREMFGCIDVIMDRFLQEGTVANLSTECVDSIGFPAFKTKD